MERSPEKALNPELAKTHLEPAEIEQLEAAIAEYEKERPAIPDFEDIRTQIDRERDQSYMEKKKKFFEHGHREVERNAQALEMVLTEFSSSWMPGYLSRTSEYDDYANYADLVLEMENDNDQILRVSIDATSSRGKTPGKIRHIIADLRQGWLSKLKYFKSQLDGSMDRKFVPQVVLGSDDPEALTSLVRLYLNYKNATDAAKRGTYRRAIQEHPFGREAFAEVEYQLKRTAAILRSADVPDEELDRKVAMVEATIAEFEKFREKKKALGQPSAQSRNGVMAAIFRTLATA